MFYSKNVPAWERAMLIVMGLAALGFAVAGWLSPLAVIAGLTGATLAMTGLIGFCPMCALAGRKLPRKA